MQMTKEIMQKLILTVLIIGGLTYVYLNYAFWPQYFRLQATEKTINQKEAYLSKLEKGAQEIQNLSARVHALEQDYTFLENQLPDILDKPDLIVYFYNLSNQYHLKTGKLQFEGSKQKGSYSTITMTYSASGTVSEILDFIDQLQTASVPRITVESMSFDPSVKTGVNNNIEVVLKLIGYAESIGVNSQDKDYMNSSFGVNLSEVITQR